MISLGDLQQRISRLKSTLSDQGAAPPAPRIILKRYGEPSAPPPRPPAERPSVDLPVAANVVATSHDRQTALLRRLHGEIRSRKSEAGETLKELAFEVVRELQNADQPNLSTPPMTSSADVALTRSLHCAALAGFLASNDDELRDATAPFVATALVQNVADVSQEDSANGMARRERHPVDAARIAESLLEFPPVWVKAILEHHERLDGGGYPNRPPASQLGIEGRLLATAERYMELRMPLMGHSPCDSKQALKQCLLESEAGQLDARWTTALLRLGFHEPGSLVELSTGATARVVANQQTRFDATLAGQPVVEILASEAGRWTRTGVFRNLALNPQIRIVRLISNSTAT